MSLSTLRGGVWIGAAQAVGRGGSFVLTVLVGRVLGEAALGAFALLWTLLALAVVLADWGQQAALTRQVAREPGGLAAHIGKSVRLALWPSLAGVVLLLGFGPLLSDAPFPASLLLALALPLLTLRNILLAVFRALGLWHWEFWTALADRALMLAGALVALWLDAGIVALCAAVLAGQLVGLLSACVGLRGRGLTAAGLVQGFGGAQAKDRASGAFLMLSSLSAAIYVRGDVLILGIFHPADVVGSYAANATLVMAAGLLPQVLLSAWYPGLSRLGGAALNHMGRAWMLLALLGLAEILVGVTIGGDLLFWVYGISGGALVACILWSAEALNSLNYAGGVVQRAADREGWLLGLMGLGALVNLAANFLLVPRYGALGAAVGTFVAYGLIAFGHALSSPLRWRLAAVVAGLALFGASLCLLAAGR